MVVQIAQSQFNLVQPFHIHVRGLTAHSYSSQSMICPCTVPHSEHMIRDHMLDKNILYLIISHDIFLSITLHLSPLHLFTYHCRSHSFMSYLSHHTTHIYLLSHTPCMYVYYRVVYIGVLPCMYLYICISLSIPLILD